MGFRIETPRLILRPWQDSDLDPFAEMSADPEVMRFFEKCLTPEEAAAAVGRYRQSYEDEGFCFWAAELAGEARFVGVVGLGRLRYEAPFTPAVEIGWRLARPWWGRGLATEGAAAALADGFSRFGLSEIVAVAVPANRASLRVMERIGMVRDPQGEFDHPNVTQGHALQRHVLFRAAA
jgi:RimJ/RimL family protein N-acetyltransferase